MAKKNPLYELSKVNEIQGSDTTGEKMIHNYIIIVLK